MMHIEISIYDVLKFHFAVCTKWCRLIIELRVNSVLLDAHKKNSVLLDLSPFWTRLLLQEISEFHLNWYNVLDIRPPIRTGFIG